MKKLILLLLLIPSLAWGQVSTSGVSLSGCSSGGASAAAACTTSNHSSLVDNVETGESASSYSHTCDKWVVASNITITKYVSRLYATTAGGVRTCLYAHDSGGDVPTPATSGTDCIAGTDKYLAHDAIADEATDTDFVLDTPKDIDAGTYWICTVNEGGVTKGQIYHAATARVAYWNIPAPDTADNAVYDIQVYGCSR
jgi:hypothetical protein